MNEQPKDNIIRGAFPPYAAPEGMAWIQVKDIPQEILGPPDKVVMLSQPEEWLLVNSVP